MIFRLIVLVASLITTSTYANEDYVNVADKEFEELLSFLSVEEKGHWETRAFNDVMAHSKIIEEINETHNYIRSQNKSKEIEGILAYSFLSEVMYNKLKLKTKLTNELGQHIYSLAMKKDIEPIKVAIEVELVGLQNVNGAIQLQSQLSSYFSLLRRLEKRQENPPVLESLDFRPKKSAWDSNPTLVEEFVLYDWVAAINLLSEDKDKLQSLKDSFVSFNYLRLKDPIAFVSLGCQLAILLVAVAGYLISYTRQPSLKVIMALVSLSILSSIVLIFVSSSTILNLFLQAIVPGLFVAYWVYQKHIENKKQTIT
ncbi:hypothetical protein [Aeromonas jandaei]|uniref:hypothetical protein n=1 Tax=Aeromonas jandaei TaxID=650 RepID=UPI003BA31F27